MNDTQRAAHLVTSDALSSRGFAYSDLETAERERELNDDDYEPTRSTFELSSRNGKGKERALDIEHEQGPDTEGAVRPAWAPEGPQRGSYARLEAGRRASWAGGAGNRSESAEARRLRRLWWKAAAINVLFIAAWYIRSLPPRLAVLRAKGQLTGARSACRYIFSTLISVYSMLSLLVAIGGRCTDEDEIDADKWMFSEDHFNFPYPLFVTSIHMLVQWTLAALTLTAFPRLRPKARPLANDYATKVAPCGMATGLDIGLSNLSLRTITLSFYTMCKSSSLAFVLIFAFLFRLEVPSWRLAGIILIITSGVILMVSTETQFNFAGMVEVLTASALGGLRWSLTQLLLDKESMGMGNPIATLFWLAPIMGVTLATCSMIFDGWLTVLGNEVFFGSLGRTLHTIAAIIFPGVIAFSMNVTESVAGIFKEVAVIFLSMFIFHDQLTPINVSGLIVTIFGIALYNYLKYRQFTTAQGATPMHQAHSHQNAGQETVGDSSYEEEEPMLLRGMGSRSGINAGLREPESTRDADAAPFHSLGDPSSARSSLDAAVHLGLGSAEDASPLVRVSEDGKAHQHDRDQIRNLAQLVEDDAELLELEGRTKVFEAQLDQGLLLHRRAGDADRSLS
ncbi:SPOSA6832_04206 [Sporobolomyces salmonicolor]|uniref:SPOSA6832_04206-mRNA-1:cds n=1 Tax=Sporidiobolus salmonicolor TaxID=5005 RepID=A0A0D6ER14_SPOSA|nr:SPOSA6832_04206 [Sporobolomyces salmonicolor]